MTDYCDHMRAGRIRARLNDILSEHSTSTPLFSLVAAYLDTMDDTTLLQFADFVQTLLD